MHALSIVFAVVITLFLPLYNIANCELLEEFDVVKNCVTLKEPNFRGQIEKSRPKLLIFRVAFLILTIAFAFLTDKVEVVLNFSGAVLVPIICFYLPVLANMGTNKLLGCKPSYLGIAHDVTIILVSMVSQVFSVHYSLWCEILGHAC